MLLPLRALQPSLRVLIDSLRARAACFGALKPSLRALLLLSVLLLGAILLTGGARRNARLLRVSGDLNPQAVATLLERGANPRARDENGNTPLHEAALALSDGDNTRTIKLLVERGADVNAANALGDRPIHYAIWLGNASSVRALLQNGASVEVESRRFGTPLRQAAEALQQQRRSHDLWEKPLTEIVRSLRAAGAKK